MMEPDTTQAIEVIRQGNLPEGAKILSQVLKNHPEDEQAWLWMSACVTDHEKKVFCLQKVLKINPASQAARRGLAAMGVPVPEEERQPVPPNEGNAFSYRDLTAAFGGHTPQAEEQAPMMGGTFADAVRQAQATPPIEDSQPMKAAPSTSGERAMMLEDFGFATPEPEAETKPQSLEPVEPQPKPARRRRGKNNWALGIIILLLALLLIFVLVAKFVIHVI
jgi:hypothetical protein